MAEREGVLGRTLAVFDGSTPLTTAEVANTLGIERRSAYDRLDQLSDRGAIDTKKIEDCARIWWRPDGDTGGDIGVGFGDFAVWELLDALEDVVYVFDVEGTLLRWNDRLEAVTGYDGSELAEMGPLDFVPDEHADTVTEAVDRVLDGESTKVEVPLVTADCEPIPYEFTGAPLADEDGTVVGFTGVGRNVSERKKRKRQLQEERDLTERLLEAVPESIVVIDAEGNVVRANRRAERRFDFETEGDGYTVGDVDVYDEDGELIPPEERPYVRVFETGEPVEDWECQIDLPGRGRRWVTINAVPLHDDGDSVDEVVITARDVTRLKEQAERIERQRDELESELSEVFERIDDGFYAVDDEFRFTYVNDRAEDLLQHDEEELLGESVWEVFPEARDTDAWDAFHEALESQEPTGYDLYYEPLEFWVEANVYPSESGLSVYFRDVTKRKQWERRLRESERRYRTLAEHVPNGAVLLFDEDLRYTLVEGQIFEEIDLDPAEMVGRTVHEAFSNEHAGKIAPHYRAAIDGEQHTYEVTYEGRQFQVRTLPVTDDGEVMAGMAMTQDITERKERERELEQYETIVETVNDGIYVVDQEGYFLTVNETYESMVGIPREDLVGSHVSTVIDDEEIIRTAKRLEAELAAGKRSTGSLEATFTNADGVERTFEATFALMDADDGYRRIGVVRDITERKERERALEEAERRYQALAEHFPDGAVGVYDEHLRYTHVSGAIWDDIEPDAADLEGRVITDTLPPETAADVEPLFRAGLEGETDSVTTEFADRTFEVWAMPIRDSEGDVFAGLSFSVEITDRVERERQLERQRERLAALDELNRVVRDINENVLELSTREDVERVVCERLAESDSYTFACVFEPDPRSEAFEKRIEAGVEGYVEEFSDEDVPDSERTPGMEAVETGEMQVVNHAQTNPAFEGWRDLAETHDYRSLAAVPISHENVTYGVLAIYSERPEAFTGPEYDVVEQLGEIVGSTIAAAERKHALMGETVVELEFQLRGFFEHLDLSRTEGRLEFDRIIPVGDETFLGYGSVTDDGVETLRAICDRLPHAESVRTYEREFGDKRFELRLEDPPVASAVASHGGSIENVVLAEGDSHMTAHLPPSVDVREVADVVREAYPTAEMLTRRQVSESDEQRQAVRALTGELTERQRAALEVSYYAGFFEWPRENSGDEIAESLDISPPTFHQHLRAAQKKVLAAVFE